MNKDIQDIKEALDVEELIELTVEAIKQQQKSKIYVFNEKETDIFSESLKQYRKLTSDDRLSNLRYFNLLEDKLNMKNGIVYYKLQSEYYKIATATDDWIEKVERITNTKFKIIK